MAAADAIYCGFADIHVPAAGLPELPQALADCRNAGDVRARLNGILAEPAPSKLPAARSWIDACFGAADVETIVARLAASDAEAAQAALATMQKASPTSLKIALRNVHDARSFKQVEQCFQQDYRIALACIAEHDFIEGIRAQIVDKDRNPIWRPARLEDVTADIVDRHFKSVGELELTFPE